MDILLKFNQKKMHIIFIVMCLISLTSCQDESPMKEWIDNIISFGKERGILADENGTIQKEKYSKISDASDSLRFKEHFVFYVDYSYSMVMKKYANDKVEYKGRTQTLMAHVKEQLISAVPKIKSDGELSIDIVPFYDSALTPLKSYNIRKKGEAFESKDIDSITSFIRNINAKSGSYHTHHYLVIEDFINRCNKPEYQKWVNILVLLTDGKDEYNLGPKKVKSGLSVMSKWINDKNNKWYGVFVDIKNNISSDLADYFDKHSEKHLSKKDGLDFNFNFFNIKSQREIAYRTDSILTIPHSGYAPQKISFDKEGKHTITSDDFYNYTLTQPINIGDSIKYFGIKVSPKNDNVLIDDKTEIKLPLYYNWGDSKAKNIPDNDILYLTVYDDKSPMIGLNISENIQKIKYYNKWFLSLGNEYADTTSCIYIKYRFDKDAVKLSKTCKLQISNVPSYMKLINEDGTPIEKNIIEIENKDSGYIAIRATIIPQSLKGNYVDSLNLQIMNAGDYKTIIINGVRLGKIDLVKNAVIIKTVERWHPISIFLFWLITILLLLWLLTMVAIIVYRKAQPKFKDKIPVIQFGTEPLTAGKNLDPNDFSFKTDDYDYLYKHIQCIRLESSAQYEKHEIWSLKKWWNFYRAYKGDIHIHKLKQNIFVNTIEFRPTNKGIDVYVDNAKKCEINNLHEPKTLAEKYNNGELIKLIAYGLEQSNVIKKQY